MFRNKKITIYDRLKKIVKKKKIVTYNILKN